MRFQFASLFLTSTVATVLAQRGCGAPEPSDELKDAAARFAADARIGNFQVQQALIVDTYFHVVSSGTTEAQGNVPDSKLRAQVSKGP